MRVSTRKSQEFVVLEGADDFKRLLEVTALEIRLQQVRLGSAVMPRFRSNVAIGGHEPALEPARALSGAHFSAKYMRWRLAVMFASAASCLGSNDERSSIMLWTLFIVLLLLWLLGLVTSYTLGGLIHVVLVVALIVLVVRLLQGRRLST